MELTENNQTLAHVPAVATNDRSNSFNNDLINEKYENLQDDCKENFQKITVKTAVRKKPKKGTAAIYTYYHEYIAELTATKSKSAKKSKEKSKTSLRVISDVKIEEKFNNSHILNEKKRKKTFSNDRKSKRFASNVNHTDSVIDMVACDIND